MPAAMRSMARPVVGVIAGSAFTPEVIQSAIHWWDAILAVLAFTLFTTALGNFYFRKIARFDQTTAFFASSPGGLGEMTLLGGMLGGDMPRLVLVHIVRIVSAVVLIPLFFQLMLGQSVGRIPLTADITSVAVEEVLIFALCAGAGMGLGRLVRFPAGLMVFPLLFSAVAHGSGLVHSTLPLWVTALMQVIVGSIAGGRFGGIHLREVRDTLFLSVIWALATIFLAVSMAWLSSWFLGRPFQAMVLALAPGGMVEMITITFALSIEVAFVVTCHVFRILLVMTFMPVCYRLILQNSIIEKQEDQ
jgi:membrane AbrB-like protein